MRLLEASSQYVSHLNVSQRLQILVDVILLPLLCGKVEQEVLTASGHRMAEEPEGFELALGRFERFRCSMFSWLDCHSA